ncbi:hypothetical protein [Arthrobacter sp. MYb213]|uniref:hypothetical protein n=1 Tax=Arthrobacter sp. MYb213 TaxID=1848595 RepID=UPI000CFC0AAC|nr:hypothetical protein [Arthrobacter sp. MYb213]PRB71353.1 hypothetical protein CQ011_05485 [Arthrobacter sp. MYb213]
MADRPVKELASLIIGQERTALTKALDAAVSAFHSPPDGSARAVDKKVIDAQPTATTKHLRGMTNSLVQDAYGLLRSMDQYARAIQHLLTSDQMLPLPTSSMVRSIHEFALILSQLFDPDLPSEVRLARMGAMHLSKAQGGLDALQTFPQGQQQELEAKIKAVAGIQGYMKKAGYEIQLHKDNQNLAKSVSWGTSKNVSLRGNTTAASKLYTPGIHYNWVLGSGATHGHLWYSAGMRGPWDTIVVGLVVPLLDISDLLVDILLKYGGVNGDDLHRQTHTRRCILLAKTNPSPISVDYDQYRVQTKNDLDSKDHDLSSTAWST